MCLTSCPCDSGGKKNHGDKKSLHCSAPFYIIVIPKSIPLHYSMDRNMVQYNPLHPRSPPNCTRWSPCVSFQTIQDSASRLSGLSTLLLPTIASAKNRSCNWAIKPSPAVSSLSPFGRRSGNLPDRTTALRSCSTTPSVLSSFFNNPTSISRQYHTCCNKDS